MTRWLKAVLVASTIASVPLVGVAPAQARTHAAVVFDAGNIAFAYNDGYWDRAHHWHRWANREERYRYRAAYRDHYYDWSHRRVPGYGWRRHDRWWNHDRDDHRG